MQLTIPDFTVLNYEYMNTGGNTMVGIHTIYIPNEKRVIYALSNEEGCTLSVVDYISNDLNIDDYEALWIDTCDYGRITGYEKYFELYRRCLNDYTKSDCRYFGVTRNIPAFLLSDKLQEQIDPDYQHWLNAHNYDVETDGEIIIMHPDYDENLRSIISFKNSHDELAFNPDARELLYDHDYTLVLGTEAIHIPFNADTYSAVEQLLKTVIDNW